MDPLSAVLTIGSKVIDRLWPDPTQRDAAKLELLKMQQNGELVQLRVVVSLSLAQIEVNKEEAKSSDPFTSRARPFIMWICGVAIAYSFVLRPFVHQFAQYFGVETPMLELQTDQLWVLMTGLLGLGGARTFEKIKGVAS
jgi:hypothetical protein